MNHTPTSVINRDYAKLKTKHGPEWTNRYFRDVDYLFNPNKIEIVEYRYAGVVTNDCDCYHFHAIWDTKIKPRVAFVIDVSDQFIN